MSTGTTQADRQSDRQTCTERQRYSFTTKHVDFIIYTAVLNIFKTDSTDFLILKSIAVVLLYVPPNCKVAVVLLLQVQWVESFIGGHLCPQARVDFANTALTSAVEKL